MASSPVEEDLPSTLECRILNAYKSEKSHVPLFLNVKVANKGAENVWLAPAHHITDLYYDSGESHTLRLGLRCKLSRAQTPGAQLIEPSHEIDFTVEATPFADMPEGDYTIVLELSPISSAYTPRYTPSPPPFAAPSASSYASHQSCPSSTLSSAPYHLDWKHPNNAPPAEHHLLQPAVARCVAEDQLAAYFSPRTSRPRPRAKSRPSLGHIGDVSSVTGAARALGSSEGTLEEHERMDEKDERGGRIAPADISPLARYATGRRFSMA